MYIGVDIGGTNVTAGLVSIDGEILFQNSCPTLPSRGWDMVIQDIINLIREIINQASNNKNVLGIGIGVPGVADPNTGNVVHCVNLGWENVPLGKTLEKEFNKPVYIDNDASVAALAEFENGALKGTQNSILITLGTGIGGGFIINGRLYSGTSNIGSEIGHTVIGENFYDCNCGKNGCFETFSSATALIRYTKKLMEEARENTVIGNYIDNDLDKLNAKVIFDCAKAGDKLALSSVNRLVDYLIIGITNLINLLDPEIIAIGGGISKAGDYLLELISHRIHEKILFKDMPYSKIAIAKHGNDAGIIGSAMLCKHS
ncbi:ROK family protein [Proteiniborus sp. MB09-C3]|uniref:ROK family protein n=1 Tax=Proteiniborus sp. MB09-C3 TaxID=3050072 RepID=UPI002557AEE6|nr:ROK family protein [Proteiniborus sp. MB09-C3]WIV13121.1 ROK family protein [Proteiniborus sp. MB09-C3]